MTLQLVDKLAEVKLMQMVGDLRAAPGWVAIYFRLSELLEEYKSEYQVKIAINLIHDLLKKHEGSIFLMNDSSIIVLCQKIEAPLLEKLIFQLRYLYMDDPLAYTDTGQDNPRFCTVYDIKGHWQEFHDICSKHMAQFARKQPMGLQQHAAPAKPVERAEPKRHAYEPVLPMVEKPPEVIYEQPEPPETGGLSASKLVTIEKNLRVIDLQSAIRRQPVCAVLSDMTVRRVFDELYINIAHLRRSMKSEVDFLSNRWLFKYITNILDERMIAILRSNPGKYLASPISINLNVETLLSSWFAEFDAMIKPATKVSIVIEVPVVDVFADMTAFTLARTEVQKLGYRICLDGLTTASFTSINREKLGLDLVKVQWNADMQSDLKTKESLALIDAVQQAGNKRVILCRCDNRSAVEYGQALGISLFQGRYLDNVLNPTAKVEN